MIYLKSTSEIKTMLKAGLIAAAALKEVEKQIKPGIRLSKLDEIAEVVIRKMGAESSFKKVENYKYTICATPNNQVVHGIPGSYKLKNGDLVGIDLGAYYKGYNSDLAKTYPVGRVSSEIQKFLQVGEEALQKAIQKVKVGNHIGDISSVIAENVETAGYSVVREFVGHGVGRQLHEDPLVPGIGKANTGLLIEEGMVLAVEVIYNKGGRGVRLLPDGWSTSTTDNQLSGLFEKTVAATKKGPLVLTEV